MGCIGSPKVITIEKSIHLIKDKDFYTIRHEKLESLIGKGKSLYDSQKELMSNFNNVDAIIARYEQKAQEIKLPRDELKLAILELFAENYIRESLKLKNYDILEYAHDMLNNQNGIKQSGCKELLSTMINHFSRIFPKEQYLSIFEFEKGDNFENTFSLRPIFNNFKYNSSYQVQALSIYLNKFILSKPEYLKEIAEVIEAGKNLTTVVLYVNDGVEAIDDATFANTLTVIRSIKRNRNVKVFTMITKENGKLTLNSELEKALVDLIYQDFLIGFGLHKFGISDEFMKGINQTLPQLQNLKFISLESKTYSNLTLLDAFSKSIGKNNSIMACLLAGFPVESKFNDLKSAQKFNQKLKFFEYENEIFLNI
jgi:hypothetical protein